MKLVRRVPDTFGIPNRTIMSNKRWFVITRYIDLGSNILTDKYVNGILLHRLSDGSVIKTIDLDKKLRPFLDGLNLIFGKYKTLERNRSIGTYFLFRFFFLKINIPPVALVSLIFKMIKIRFLCFSRSNELFYTKRIK